MSARLVVVSVAALALLVPQGASARIIVSDLPQGPVRSTLVVLGTQGDNRVAVSFTEPDFIVKSPEGIKSFHCTPEDSTTVRCPRYGPRIRVSLRDGDDRLTLTSAVVGGVADGEGGADTLIGSSSRNDLIGGLGADTLRGRGGDDRLLPQEGTDALWGGVGDDRIHADDDHRDRIIDCGPGNDLAFVDRGVDPDPEHCERVRFNH